MVDSLPEKMWKSTIIIWTDYDPISRELEDLAREATSGDAYCSKQQTTLVMDVTTDPDWDGTDFFGLMADAD